VDNGLLSTNLGHSKNDREFSYREFSPGHFELHIALSKVGSFMPKIQNEVQKLASAILLHDFLSIFYINKNNQPHGHQLQQEMECIKKKKRQKMMYFIIYHHCNPIVTIAMG
jgi:hypothetical protein